MVFDSDHRFYSLVRHLDRAGQHWRGAFHLHSFLSNPNEEQLSIGVHEVAQVITGC